MPTIPRTFEEIEHPGLPNGADGHFEIAARELATVLRRPCWESAVFQWLATEISAHPLFIRSGTSTTPAEALSRTRDSLCGASVCLLPADLFQAPSPNEVGALREALVGQQEEWPDLASTGSAFVVCADHLVITRPARPGEGRRAAYALPRRLYPPSGQGLPADWNGFNNLVRDLVRRVCGKPMQPVWYEPSHETAIPTIFHELFKNTHEHARTWWDGTKPKFSLRGVTCNYFDLDSFDYLDRTSTAVVDPASAYVREILDMRKARGPDGVRGKRVEGFLELSIFDTGPGLVGRAISGDPSHLSSNDQLDIVKRCLRTGYSSTDNETRGYGLSKVLSRLRKSRGFIRIRTNGVNAYRSFARFSGLESKPGDADAGYDRLLDWKILYSPKQSAYRNLRGTVVTVMLPMGEADEETANP